MFLLTYGLPLTLGPLARSSRCCFMKGSDTTIATLTAGTTVITTE